MKRLTSGMAWRKSYRIKRQRVIQKFIQLSTPLELPFSYGGDNLNCRKQAFTFPPAKELALPCLPVGKFLENCAFATEKQPTSIAIGWSEPVLGRESHPLESSAFHVALLRQLELARPVTPPYTGDGYDVTR